MSDRSSDADPSPETVYAIEATPSSAPRPRQDIAAAVLQAFPDMDTARRWVDEERSDTTLIRRSELTPADRARIDAVLK